MLPLCHNIFSFIKKNSNTLLTLHLSQLESVGSIFILVRSILCFLMAVDLCMCVRAKSLHSCSDSLPHYGPQSARSVGFSRQEYWSGLACPPLDLCTLLYNHRVWTWVFRSRLWWRDRNLMCVSHYHSNLLGEFSLLRDLEVCLCSTFWPT